jgi:hypothetical protein
VAAAAGEAARDAARDPVRAAAQAGTYPGLLGLPGRAGHNPSFQGLAGTGVQGQDGVPAGQPPAGLLGLPGQGRPGLLGMTARR